MKNEESSVWVLFTIGLLLMFAVFVHSCSLDVKRIESLGLNFQIEK